MGGSDWCDKFATGFPISGELGEPGVYRPSNEPPSLISGEELFANAPERFLSNNRAPDPNERLLWFEALGQVKQHWRDGPRRFNEKGELLVGDEPFIASRGAQQGQKLRAVDVFKRSATNVAASISTPINLPSRRHLAQMCSLFQLKGDRRSLVVAMADRADAYKQLPATTEDELTAVVTSRHPVGGMRYGFIPHTQPFGSTAAVLHYICLSRVIASLTCRALKVPCIGYYDDFGMVLPECLAEMALDVPASLN